MWTKFAIIAILMVLFICTAYFSSSKRKEKLFLKSKVRIYTEQFSLEGEKIAFETKDYFVNIILAGPLKNTNKTQLLNENIINSLKFE